MIDMPIVLAEHVHHETRIPNMVNWCDVGVANPNSNVLNFFELLLGSENNKFSFFLIELKHISGHPIFNLFNTALHMTNTVLLG